MDDAIAAGRVATHADTRRGSRIVRHKAPTCQATGLARYRDRHQARHAADAITAGTCTHRVTTFACPDCRGFHLEHLRPVASVSPVSEARSTLGGQATAADRTRRFVLFDVENLTCGAKASTTELALVWHDLKQTVGGITATDHVVVGAGRRVARRYRGAIHGPHVTWVVGADVPDGADRALLAATDLHRVAARYDELVIISGDHAFATLARRAKSLGLTVRVLTAVHPYGGTMAARELVAAADIHTEIRVWARTLGTDSVTRIHPADPGHPVTEAGRIQNLIHGAAVAA